MHKSEIYLGKRFKIYWNRFLGSSDKISQSVCVGATKINCGHYLYRICSVGYNEDIKQSVDLLPKIPAANCSTGTTDSYRGINNWLDGAIRFYHKFLLNERREETKIPDKFRIKRYELSHKSSANMQPREVSKDMFRIYYSRWSCFALFIVFLFKSSPCYLHLFWLTRFVGFNFSKFVIFLSITFLVMKGIVTFCHISFQWLLVFC